MHDVLQGSGRPLDAPVREEMEARLGSDFSDVRVHDDGAARASAAEVGARAYTSGSHVVIGDGGGDKHTLAHELTHVIQQRQGPVAGTDNGSGLRVSDPADRFEREAEANAIRVMRSPAPEASAQNQTQPRAPQADLLQRAPTLRNVKLTRQVGPSCWIFVIEAIAKAYGFPTKALNAAIRTSPLAGERDALAKTNGDTNKRKADVIIMRQTLEAIKAKIDAHGEDEVGHDRVLEIIREVMAVPSKTGPQKAGDTEGFAQMYATSLCPAGQAVTRVSLSGIFGEAIGRVEILRQFTEAGGNEANTALDASPIKISAAEGVDSARQKLAAIPDFPQFLSVAKRLGSAALSSVLNPHLAEIKKKRAAEGQDAVVEVDWSQLAAKAQASPHALLLTEYRASEDCIVFKDPNIVGTAVKLSIASFLLLAGQDEITIRTYTPGQAGSALESLADGPAAGPA
ncbi:DUF4157 domain-containing protein [Streptomyces sp. NBC_01077]|uniref:eCIS core domain-containing protein n=1 Tax=Streptomyces sp. NBC_01077 TaxID=2903746 RepID=UPI003869B9DF